MTFDCIVVGSHLRFDGVRQRPQHIATRLARRAPLLFVEEPFRAAADADEFTAYADVTVLRPKRREVGEERLGARTIAAVRAWLRGRRALLWLYTPMMLPLADAFGEAALVFDCMDDLAAFAFAPAALRERERALLERSTLVFAGGRSLYERRRAFGEKVRLYPRGVEFEHFAGAGDRAPHPIF